MNVMPVLLFIELSYTFSFWTCSVLFKISIWYLWVFNINYFLISSDEVGALVFDIGSYTVRAGYAGEDCPKVSVMFESIGYVRAIHVELSSCRNTGSNMIKGISLGRKMSPWW